MNRKPIVVPKITNCPFEHPYGYVYLYTNVVNGHRYVGKHKYPHPFIDPYYKGSGGNHWKSALSKYGWESFNKEVLFWLCVDDEQDDSWHNNQLNKYERYFIDLLGTYVNPSDYNETPGGDGYPSEMMSGTNNPMYGKTGELNPMYGKSGEKSPWWGKHHSEHSKQLIRNANLGKTLSESSKAKISRANSGHKAYKNQREFMSRLGKSQTGSNNPMWKGGKQIVNSAHSEFMKGKHMSPKTEFSTENSSGARNSQAKPVVRLSMDGTLLQEYGYLKEVAKDPMFPSEEAVRACCKGRKSWYKGYRWMYKDDYCKGVDHA